MTNAKILVEKNIPMQKSTGGNPQKYPFDDMAVNDSFDAGEYDRKKMQSIYGSIYHFIGKKENKKKKFVCRKTEDGRMRVWREK